MPKLRPGTPLCGRHVWRCTGCRTTVAKKRANDGKTCPKCPPGTPYVDGTCEQAAGPFGAPCRRHGGNAPQIKAAGARKTRRREAELLVERLAIPIPGTDPYEALQAQMDLYRGIVHTLTVKVNELDLDITRREYDPETDRWVENGVDGIAVATYHQSGLPTGEAKPQVYVAMLKEWGDAYNKLVADCAKIGIEERRTAVAERIDQNTLDRLQAALNVALAVLDPAQAALFRQALAAELPRQDPPAIER